MGQSLYICPEAGRLLAKTTAGTLILSTWTAQGSGAGATLACCGFTGMDGDERCDGDGNDIGWSSDWETFALEAKAFLRSFLHLVERWMRVLMSKTKTKCPACQTVGRGLQSCAACLYLVCPPAFASWYGETLSLFKMEGSARCDSSNCTTWREETYGKIMRIDDPK